MKVSAATALMLTLPVAALVPDRAVAQERYHPFQQGVEYRIEATQDDGTAILTGRARLRYTNNAPGPLDRLYFHQYLNAFRPNSAWSREDLRVGDRTFQQLGPEEHGFERITAMAVDGNPVSPVYPESPDSTVFYVALPAPLGPGESLEAVMDWQARTATEPRRQGRAGRHVNWAHWYPRIAVYGSDGWEYRPHVRQGELNGTFGAYDVTLELPADQVVGATGVPVSGDPGWERAAVPGSLPPVYLREHYGGHPEPFIGLLEGGPDPDRKRIRWRAESVHNFAWSTSPDYSYLGGRWNETPIHILWHEESPRWDGPSVLDRQKDALDWVEALFGEYPWPQITITDRVEGGATEFPMLYMTSGGAVVHETMHMVAHGILANNEWREGWLDEGMASFLTSWLREEEGRSPEEVWPDPEGLARLDAAGRTQPVGLPGDRFATYQLYSTMTYRKGSAVLRMLRDMLGEEAFRDGLRAYYEDFRFRQVTGHDFRRSMEEASGRDLEWFFTQWLETTASLDYRVGSVVLTGSAGDYRLRVEVVRDGDAWMPVVVEAAGRRVVADGRGRVQTVTLQLDRKPDRVILDPDGSLLDTNRGNNRRAVR